MLTLQSHIMTWLEFDQISDLIWNHATVSHPIHKSQFHYGAVQTHASWETARTWESFDHRGLEYPPYRQTTIQI